MAEFKMAAIIKLSENEWVWVRISLFQIGVRVFLSESEKFWSKMAGLNPTWQNSRWLCSSSWVRMNEWSFLCKMAESKMAEFKMAAIIKLSQNEWVWVNWISFNQSFVQNGWIQDGRIQDGCHHQVESEWMSLSQIELVSESEFLSESKWLNPRWHRIQDGCHHQE